MKTVARPMQPRDLIAAFRFNEKTFVWRCDHCYKMFFLEVEQALADGIPRMTLREFESHSCAFAKARGTNNCDEDLREIVILPSAPDN
jgi:hypothetical protein